MIRFENVSKRFGGVSALSDVTFEVKDGEFVFLIGPSGAGKTTLLRLLIRDIVPTKGKVHVGQWEINVLPASKVHLLRRHVGVVFQDFKLLTDRTVYENIAIGLEIFGKPSQDVKKRVTEVAELVGLVDKQNLFPLQLSAGEMQRTSIARALVGGPKVLLADEPTGNLDPETAWEILKLFGEANSQGTMVIMATHNAGIVDTLHKRVIALDRGSVVRDEEKGSYKPTSAKIKKNHGNR